MDYIKVTYPKPDDPVQSEILIANLAEAGFESFEETDTQVLAYIPADDFNESTLPAGYEKPEIEVIKDQNWNAVWESNYDPVLINEKVYIRAPFHESKDDVEYEIVINPKMAFGTAHHETTALMIEYLLEMKSVIKSKTVLDMGCGTGVLAILSKLEGAGEITAIDNDTWSVESSKENADINNVPSVNVLLGDASTLPGEETFDLILANINKNILLNDMPAYEKSLKKNGHILFSGFYYSDLKDIKNQATSLGLIFEDFKTKNSWTAARFAKPGN